MSIRLVINDEFSTLTHINACVSTLHLGSPFAHPPHLRLSYAFRIRIIDRLLKLNRLINLLHTTNFLQSCECISFFLTPLVADVAWKECLISSLRLGTLLHILLL